MSSRLRQYSHFINNIYYWYFIDTLAAIIITPLIAIGIVGHWWLVIIAISDTLILWHWLLIHYIAITAAIAISHYIFAIIIDTPLRHYATFRRHFDSLILFSLRYAIIDILLRWLLLILILRHYFHYAIISPELARPLMPPLRHAAMADIADYAAAIIIDYMLSLPLRHWPLPLSRFHYWPFRHYWLFSFSCHYYDYYFHYYYYFHTTPLRHWYYYAIIFATLRHYWYAFIYYFITLMPLLPILIIALAID